MSIRPIPPPLEHLGARPFSLYPAILNIEHNEWLFRKATWSEILVGLMVGVLGTLAVVMVTREGTLRQRIVYTNKDADFLDLSARDDYNSVIRKLGTPASDHSVTRGGELEFQSLWYPQRGYYAI